MSVPSGSYEASQSSPLRTPSRPPPPIGVVRAGQDPFDRVFRFGGKAGRVMLIALGIALVAETASGAATLQATLWGLGQYTKDVSSYVNKRLSTEVDVELIEEKKPDPPKEEPPKEEPKIEPTPVVKQVAPVPQAAPPPVPKAAEATKILTKEDDTVDLTKDPNAIVSGNNTEASSGASSTQGKGNVGADTNKASPNGNTTAAVPMPTAPPAPPPPAVDRSRVASAVNKDWSWCPFPPEADTAQIDEAAVIIQVQVGPDGSPRRVFVLNDPGNGFGREATKCAMRAKYSAPFDRDGNAIEGKTNPIRITFSR